MHGYSWREVDEKDLGALEALDAACLQADGPASVMRATYRELIASPSIPMTCAVPDRGGPQIAAVGWVQDRGGQAWLGGKVHPEQRRRKVGTSLLRRTEVAAMALAGAESFVIVNEALSDGSAALYAQEGYTCDFVEQWMQRDLLEPVPPVATDFPTVAWSQENAMQFFEAYREAFRTRRRPGSPEPDPEEWLKGYTEDADFRPDLSRLVLANGKPGGFVTAGIMSISQLNQTVGWISQVGVDPQWRGRGVAAGLIVGVMNAFKSEGFEAAGLHVNIDNLNAIHLYERLGFRLAGRRAKYSKPRPS